MKECQSFHHLNTEQVKNLMQCMAVCRSWAKMCIDAGHKKTAAICCECADVCELALKFKCCESEFAHKVLDLCCHICKKCADECENHSTPHCKECKAVCLQCSNCCECCC